VDSHVANLAQDTQGQGKFVLSTINDLAAMDGYVLAAMRG
jgi:hypothetical protein